MKLCPNCLERFIKNNRKQCRVCYLKTCVEHKPVCGCGKKLSNYNNTICKKCYAKLRGKKIEQMDMQGNHLSFWNSTQEAARLLELRQSDLVKCLHGKRNKTGGFIWKYVFNEEIKTDIFPLNY